MHEFTGLLLRVWREASRHDEIEQSTREITAIVAHQLPLARTAVGRFDARRACIDTVAEATLDDRLPKAPARTSCRPEQFRELLAKCREVGVARLPAGEAPPNWLAPVVPTAPERDVMAGILGDAAHPIGTLLLIADEGGFSNQHAALLEALLEPFSVALENDRRLREVQALREAALADRQSLLARLGRTDLADQIVGADSGLREVMERVDLVARSEVPVLIFGETGAGKELVARAIRNRSPRASGPFLRVNCGAIPPGLIDSELFGHERGSFTGATAARHGWFERADRGTLFLDEVGDLPHEAQARLLRVLQDGVFERVGGHHAVQVDVRIIAATNRDLRAMVQRGEFREDLWYRLAVFPISLPPLRDRPEDIPALAAHFARRAATRFGLPLLLPEREDLDRMVAYSWPGNIRELAAVIDRAALLGNGRRLEIAVALGTAGGSPPPSAASSEGQTTGEPSADRVPLDAAMRAHIERTLALTHGRIEGPFGAAARLDVNPHTLRARMRRLGIDWTRFRPKRRALAAPTPRRPAAPPSDLRPPLA